ncbi:MAG: alginate lyase family protein [Myxococcales bacterium]|nr:alginate lyase family protein [Myxococcales bacterium]
MGALEYYAAVVRQLGAAKLARALARRTRRAVRRALRRPRQWSGQQLAAALGLSEQEAAQRLLDPSAARAWCDVAQRPSVLAVMERLPSVRERALCRAAEAVRRRFRVFGHDVAFSAGEAVDWSFDASSGHRFSQAPSRAVRAGPGVDPKYAWALGRMDQLVALGQGYWASDEPAVRGRCARELVEQVLDFSLMNPVGVGVQWASPMEVSLRAANLAQALRMFRDHPSVRAPAFALEALAAIESHGDFVEAHLEDQGAVPNNHLVADFLGMLVAGLLFPDLPGSPRRIALSVEGVRAEMFAQVLPDGYSFEGSVPYHRLATELFALAQVVTRSLGVDLGAAYEERLLRMFHVAKAYCSEARLAPQIGDNDSGRAWPLRDRESLDHGYLAPFGAALFADATLKQGGDDFPDEAAWLLGERGLARFERLRPGPRPSSRAFGGGGLVVLRGGGAVVSVSAGKNGQRGVGGHSHNDRLSFELHVDGAPVVVDPGTFSYAQPELRSAFRGTAAHNTLEVRGREHSPIEPSRPFALLEAARCQVVELELCAEWDRLLARLGAYGRADPPVMIERELLLDKGGRRLAVVDRLHGKGSCELLARVHLPDEEVRLRAPFPEELARARLPLGTGALAAELGATAAPSAVVLFEPRARVRVESSAYSKGYGELRPARCVVAEFSLPLPARTAWVVLF